MEVSLEDISYIGGERPMLDGARLICPGSVAGDEICCIHVKRCVGCGKGTVVGIMALSESHETVDSPRAHASLVSGIEAGHVYGCRVFGV